jgi:hypothetical protein
MGINFQIVGIRPLPVSDQLQKPVDSRESCSKPPREFNSTELHHWDNISQTEWARVLFVLQDAQQLVVGGKRVKEDLGQGHGIVPTSGNDCD